MANEFTLGLFYKDLNNKEFDLVGKFKKSDNYRKCHTTGAKEFFLYYPESQITEDIKNLIDCGILIRYSFDRLNLYLLDSDIDNYKLIRTKEDFLNIFNDSTTSFSSYNDFIDKIKNTPKYLRYLSFYKQNKSLVKRMFYEHNHNDDKDYQEDFYSSKQEFVYDNDRAPVSSDIVGEIKTKQFQKYGNIRKYT